MYDSSILQCHSIFGRIISNKGYNFGTMADETIDTKSRPGGADGVCFTSGPKGAAFSAGVIHAWLASDRQPPLVVAGISTGALSSAAMQKSYRELESCSSGELERKRWSWFRRYLDAVTNDPLSFLWKSIPDAVDFFADKPPVRDFSASNLPKEVAPGEPEARRHYYLLVKLGMWFAGLPLRVGTIASILVHTIRWKEGYGPRAFSGLRLVGNLAKVLGGMWWHLVRAPHFYSEHHFGGGYRFRPLFGWKVWLPGMSPALIFPLLAWVSWKYGHVSMSPAVILNFGLALLLVPGLVLIALLLFPEVRWAIPKYLFQQLDLQKGLLHPFEMRRQLAGLFGNDEVSSSLESGQEMHLLVVCALLQQTKQVWPGNGVLLVDALTAAMAVPGIFPPVTRLQNQLINYSDIAVPEAIDGVAVRNNPIPAFFEWCSANEDVAKKLDQAQGPSLHVVYSVPVEPDGPLDEAPPPEAIDIVESALTALELEERRDTRQEVRQTNFLSKLESERRKATGVTEYQSGRAFRIFPDEIAPQSEIRYNNEWEPTRQESLKVVADGCRAAMETLYRNEIQELQNSDGQPVQCSRLLLAIAPRRDRNLLVKTPGLPEVCQHCNGHLIVRDPAREGMTTPGLLRNYGGLSLEHDFRHLNASKPRIVFLGNGGVFRGAFHIGVIGAMKSTGVFPDLVVGASVGSLMGGALAAISVAPKDDETRLLEQLASVFLAVDLRIALTRTIKNAAKQLGIRARNVQLSPAELRRMVLRGSKADAGFAATGSPPALIDAISQLFMIPHRCTTSIASEFVAGHVTSAVHQFLKQVRGETLQSFDVVRALMGISLLEPEARNLLGQNIKEVHHDQVQPYHWPAQGKKKVSFFCTTSFLNARTGLLLGRDFLTANASYDCVSAALASSAFPVVFSPRSEAEFVPGMGHPDRLFADGGMFDNLPFFPALEVLGDAQTAGKKKDIQSVLAHIRQRTKNRDIFIAAGLDADPEPFSDYDTLFKIRKRAKTLAANSKTETFAGCSRRAQEALQEIASPESIVSNLDTVFLDRAVSAAILKIVPTDKKHINPTFAFCKSAGMKADTVRLSIADGCFQTLLAFHKSYAHNDQVRLGFEGTEVPGLQPAFSRDSDHAHCPYFSLDGIRLECPFAAAQSPSVKAIRDVCGADKAHQGALV